MDFLISVLEQGMIYGIMALGVYITYKILDFPDLGVDGTFPMGAAVTAALLKVGVNPYLTLIIAFAAGIVAGICTGLIHVKFKVRDLLSGIIMMTGLYTIKILMDLYMKTQSGYLLRAVGDNDVIVTSLAKDKGNVKILGLAISNGLVALSGCVFAQQSKVFDISMGTGALVIGLASVIIGMSFFKKMSFVKATTAVIIGSIFYKLCVALALKFAGATATKLVTAILFLVILVVSVDRKKKVKVNA